MQNVTVVDLEYELKKWRTLAIAALLAAALFCGLLVGRVGAGPSDRSVTYRLQVELSPEGAAE